jgi:potassium efflux system protein
MAVLLVLRRRIGKLVTDQGNQARPTYCQSIWPTALALAGSVLVALPFPLALWFAAWRVNSASVLMEQDAFDLAQSVAAGLRSSAALWLLFMLAFSVTRPGGLADCHWGWPIGSVKSSRSYLRPLAFVSIPAAFLVAFGERYPIVAWRESVSRFAFIAGMLTFTYVSYQLVRFPSGALSTLLRSRKSGWLYALRHLWMSILIGVPLSLVVLSSLGYQYAAVRLLERFTWTAWLLFGLIVLHSLLVRWLLLAERRLAIRRARKAREALQAESPSTVVPQPEIKIVAVRAQTKSLVRSLVILLAALGVWSVWSSVFPALSFLEEVHLWSYTAVEASSDGSTASPMVATTHYITLANALLAFIAAALALILAKNVPGLLEITLLAKLPLDKGGRFAITSLARYTIVVVGLVVAFGNLGVGWAKIQWLAAAVTVGLGFGLQEIFANFVSGLILLFERPIRIGDTVTVGGISGDVTRIRIRATTITDWDNKELIIPNKEFVTGQVVNWSLSEKTLRVKIPVGIAYGSDIDRVESLLYKIAREAENVLSKPEPRVLFTAFGASSLDFEVRVFVPSIDYFLEVRHTLHKAIDREFRKAGIEIAFPQRDVHFDTKDPIQIQLINREQTNEVRSAEPRSADEVAADETR